MRAIDLNSDVGEGFGTYSIGMDEEVMAYITSANIACGWHAGDASVMRKTVRLARDRNVGIGAHPGYPDLVGFGRRNMECTPGEVADYVTYQVGALQAFARTLGTRVTHVRPTASITPPPNKRTSRRRSSRQSPHWTGISSA
jgi:UPF0271 protein